MKHTILCAQNAIQCARENTRDDSTIDDDVRARKLNDSQYIYDVANYYIDTQSITCVCEYEHASQIHIELRELYRFAHSTNFEFRAKYIESIDVYHVIYEITYDDATTQTTSMIVRHNDYKNKSTFENFTTFDLLNDIEIN